MKIKNPILQAKLIEENFSEYIESTFEIRDSEYDFLFKKELQKMKDSLYKGPYLHSFLPFAQEKTINELINEDDVNNPGNKILHPNFALLDVTKEHLNRKLYWHQVEAIKKIESGRSVVITTGTGSGKTQCFMYPILDSIIKEIANGNTESGVRAIFLFPMNALINDQIDRIREMLSGYQKITFGFFTGETPEDDLKKAKESFKSMYGDDAADNELLTRKQMRDTPPHILFTNYSMLEYLLLRPQDSKMISEKSLKNWRYVVLDEAHTYRGALGIEISILLRRLVGIANRKPQYILTSATLGKGKQDIKKIIKFASALTSTNYAEEDIIFARRIPLSNESAYKIEESDYLKMFENLDDLSKLISVFEKYENYDIKKTIEINLYNLLRQDSNSIKLQLLTSTGRDFFEVLNLLGFTSANNLVALIELISKAISEESTKLYDIKYHMFIKAPDGAFITLGKNKKLSLLTCKSIDNHKAFKIGICQNCKTPYIIGRIEDGILCIDDEVDIDEEYREKIKKLCYYLIADSLTSSERDDIEHNHKDKFSKYLVCPVCGSIRPCDAKSRKCNCREDEVLLYKYTEFDDPTNDVFSNNIKKCPICDYQTKNGGVVLGFHIGKDRATALIAQILYRSMDYPQIEDKNVPTGMFKKEKTYKNGVKQFIAFSDARQQAAFFNKFIDTTDQRFLKKALIWNLLSDPKNNNRPIAYPDLVKMLTKKFQSSPIELEPFEAIKHASSAALYELLNVDGRNSAEGLGIFFFALDLPDEYKNDSNIEEYLSQQGFAIKADTFRLLTQLALGRFRTVPAIIYPQLTNDPNELDDLLGYRKFINYMKLQSSQANDKVKSFLPVKSTSENKIIKYIKKVLNCDLNTAKKFLTIIYDSASQSKLISVNSDGTNQIDANKYSVHSYKEPGVKFYLCNKCKKLTVYNVNGVCPEGDCDGFLEECDPDVIYKSNYYRKEYMTRPLERVCSREHTAQIKSAEAKKIQNDFKEKKINIISCSTTFEMGINLGGLSTIFMRNVPPTPANYVQRAGRAGRSADTSAFILTFCGTSSHDYTFFNKPEPMIAGIVEPPYFTIENEKIIVRHLTASAFSFYFRKFPDSFESINVFLRDDHIQKFFNYIETKPKELGNYIDNFVLFDKDLINKFGDFKWITYLESTSKSALISMETGINDQIMTYKTAINKLNEEKPKKYWKDVGIYEGAIERLEYKNSLITYFARYGVIPRYGFPIDNTSLKIYNPSKNDFDEKYDLTRDLSVAISEYAPDSEVIVDGKKYTSRYIFTPYASAPHLKKFYVKCPHCESINLFDTKAEIDSNTKCKYCDNSFGSGSKAYKINEFIIPDKGFIADRKNKETHQIKPARTYTSDVIYVGDGKNPDCPPLNISDVVTISEFKNQQLLVLNENPFFYCPVCGYTIMNRSVTSETTKKAHKDHKGFDCPGDDGNTLYKTHFGHTYRTDVIKLEFVGIKEMMEYDTAVSVLYAILEGMSAKFSIERNDIGGMPFNSAPTCKPWELILFDNVSGGAGHVKRLESKENFIATIYAALDKVNQKCCDEDTSCYSCLRNYSNQKIHKHLKRGLARDALLKIISAIEAKTISMCIDSIAIDLSNTDLEEFSDSGYLSGDELRVFKTILTYMNGEIVDKPDGYGITIKSGDDSIYYADFIWKSKNILLFTMDNLESFEKLGDHQSKYNCYLLDDSLDVVNFVKNIRK